MMAGVHWLMLNMALNMIVDFDPAKHLVIRLYTHMQPQYFSSLQNMFKKNQLFWLYVIFISTVHGLRNIFVVDLRCHLLALTNQPIRYISVWTACKRKSAHFSLPYMPETGWL